MSTDTVLVCESIAGEFKATLSKLLPRFSTSISHVITEQSRNRIKGLLSDVEQKGGSVLQGSSESQQTSIPATIIEKVIPDMQFSHSESFGPLLGFRTVRDANEALEIMAESSYGLSAAIFSQNHFKALQIARRMKIGAVHINGSTVHDAPNLPHGGYGDSGFGRFGAHWGLMEFVQTKTIIINR